MLGFCASHEIYPEIELIPIEYCNEALDRLVKRDVKYRFVIDIANTLKWKWIDDDHNLALLLQII